MKTETLTDLQTAFSRSECQHAGAFLERENNIQTIRKVRASLTVLECGEPLAPIPDRLVLVEPHPYVHAGASYGDLSPWQVRTSVGERLSMAQARLEEIRSGLGRRIGRRRRPHAIRDRRHRERHRAIRE